MSDELRFSKIDEAIQRLAIVSADLSKMLAVHDQRLGQQEKTSDSLISSIERRRSEVDERFRDLQQSIKEELRDMRANSTKQHEEQNEKIDTVQRYIWMGMGGVFLASWIIPILINKLFH